MLGEEHILKADLSIKSFNLIAGDFINLDEFCLKMIFNLYQKLSNSNERL